MTGIGSDTAPDVEARYRDMLRARTPSDRVAMAFGMFDLARAMVLASCPPGADQGDRRAYLFVRVYAADFDAETASRIASRLRHAARDDNSRPRQEGTGSGTRR